VHFCQMGTSAETAIVNYCSSFADQGNKSSFSISICSIYRCRQSWACCAEERKSASFFLLRRNANFGV
jgi:hypothetical protein